MATQNAASVIATRIAPEPPPDGLERSGTHQSVRGLREQALGDQAAFAIRKVTDAGKSGAPPDSLRSFFGPDGLTELNCELPTEVRECAGLIHKAG